jgi:hypothetical protein
MTDGSTGGAPAPPNDSATPARWLSARNAAIGGAAVLLVLIVALALHYRGGSERRRYDAILRASLDHIVTAQEGFYYDSTRYAAALRSLPTVKLPPGVHVQIVNSDRRSWWGIATHEGSPSRRCIVWVGMAPSWLPLDARAPDEETKPLCYDASQLKQLTARDS